MRRIAVVLMVVAVMVATVATAGPAVAQIDDKAAKRAAKRADKQAAKRAAKQAQGVPADVGVQKAPPVAGEQQKMLPASGGIPSSNVALIGAGALLAGAGLLAYRGARR